MNCPDTILPPSRKVFAGPKRRFYNSPTAIDVKTDWDADGRSLKFFVFLLIGFQL